MESTKCNAHFIIDVEYNKKIDNWKWEFRTTRSKLMERIIDYLASHPEIIEEIKSGDSVKDDNKKEK